MAGIKNQVVVVGGGPAGIMAAIRAAERGRRVLLLERTGELGKKLLISGGGRCNLTNRRGLDEFLAAYHNGAFLRNAFARFFNQELMDFFESGGIKLTVERGQRVFPASQSSAEIVAFLRRRLEAARVQLWFRNRLIRANPLPSGWELVTRQDTFSSETLLLATGGRSYPETGSTGDGYNIARRLGHTINKPRAALCGLELKEKWIRDWQGVSLENVALTLSQGDRELGSEFGEAIFTHYGLSGPAVLNLSRILTGREHQAVTRLSIDFKPALDAGKLDQRLQRELNLGRRQVKNILRTLLPMRLVERFLSVAGLPAEKPAHQVTAEERRRLLEQLKAFPLTVAALRPADEAIVTRGGVEVKEIDPRRLESRLHPGLFFAGELIDVDGPTGGFNLQAAFTTGYVAGSHL
ncbi:MAG TPA: NAD(P)/FAD-dependent oxidoreductase [bacterium]|nr:NAD(P)/FAD-dependent oxidoreductase [bacterium]HNS48474.1 NAD(P)/FAD-dependent oxidoreductase [bacterium]